MRLLIHDLREDDFTGLLPHIPEDIRIVSDDHTFRSCIGCFGCWVKTPGACVIRDQYGDMGERIAKCDEVMIISKCFYGGFSPFVKKVLDRSIPYIHPDFQIRNGEMHHKRRYDNYFDMKVWFYGENITEQEKQTAKRLIKANAINLLCEVKEVAFVRDVGEIRGISDEAPVLQVQNG